MTVPIIDGLAIPLHQRKGAQPKYPWLQLKPGQAFKFTDGISVASAKSMATQVASGCAMKFAVRQTANGVFCWRVDGMPDAPKSGNYRQEVPVIEDYAKNPLPATETAVIGYEPKPRRPEDEGQHLRSQKRGSNEASNEAALARISGEEVI